MATRFPLNQCDLIRAARGGMTQAEFAYHAGIGRTALCKYEGQKLGVPPKFLNFCLAEVAKRLGAEAIHHEGAKTALAHARQTVQELEKLAQDDKPVGG